MALQDRAERLVVFDVNETLSDLGPLADAFVSVGAPGHLVNHWFSSVLRDGFALSLAGECPDFAELGRSELRGLLSGYPLRTGADAAVEAIMAAFAGLPVHPDVADGIRALRDKGLRVCTLSNGGTAFADALLTHAGVRDLVAPLLSVQDVGAWKPRRAAYEYVTRATGVAAADLLLVAVHPWDCDGALRAGLEAAWINRTGVPYPTVFTTPSYSAASIVELAEKLRT
ncbi:MAG: haloacid dehalogenase type II [Geodermatophilaceae bacterium]|nr:haloacid dehalogenase type II [Geodermatophilaceae bacterium]